MDIPEFAAAGNPAAYILDDGTYLLPAVVANCVLPCRGAVDGAVASCIRLRQHCTGI